MVLSLIPPIGVAFGEPVRRIFETAGLRQEQWNQARTYPRLRPVEFQAPRLPASCSLPSHLGIGHVLDSKRRDR